MLKINYNRFEKLMFNFQFSKTHLRARSVCIRVKKQAGFFQIEVLLGEYRVIFCFPALAARQDT